MRETSKFFVSVSLTLGMTVAGFAAPGVRETPSNGAYLGVMVDNVSPETAAALHLTSGGTVIANVDQDGPACKAGLKGGDVVTAFNGKSVSGRDQFASLIQECARQHSDADCHSQREDPGHESEAGELEAGWQRAMPPPRR